MSRTFTLYQLEYILWIGYVALVAIAGTTILVPYLEIKSLPSFEDQAPIDKFMAWSSNELQIYDYMARAPFTNMD